MLCKRICTQKFEIKAIRLKIGIYRVIRASRIYKWIQFTIAVACNLIK